MSKLEYRHAISELPLTCLSAESCMVLIDFPRTRQLEDFDCGAAVVQGLLRYFGEERTLRELKQELQTDLNGTRPWMILRFLRTKFSVQAGLMDAETLRDFLDAGVPVLLMIQAWGDTPEEYKRSSKNGHYVVAVGYDRDDLILEDPYIEDLGRIPWRDLDARWHDVSAGLCIDHFGAVVRRAPEPTRVAARWRARR